MAKPNKRCMACGTKYTHCPDCSRADALKPSWASEFCSEPCKDLWLTLTRYNMGTNSKSEAKALISALDLKPIDAYAACVQRDYAKVMASEPKPKRGKRAEMKILDEIADVEPANIIDAIELASIKVQVVPEPDSITHEGVTIENE